jgi:hypothetical protein
MAFGVDLNRPAGEGDGNDFLYMNEEPTGGEEQHQVASDTVFPLISILFNLKIKNICKHVIYVLISVLCGLIVLFGLAALLGL